MHNDDMPSLISKLKPYQYILLCCKTSKFHYTRLYNHNRSHDNLQIKVPLY